MPVLRNVSIKAKLIALAAISVTVALLLAGILLAYNDVCTMRRSKVEQLQTQARMLGFNCTGVLTFQDAKAAKQLLTSLALQPTVELACLYDVEGQVLAGYSRIGTEMFPSLPPKRQGHDFTRSGHLEIYHQVFDQGEPVGTLLLRANMKDLYGQLTRYGTIVVAVMFGALGASIALSLKLQKMISEPIRRLAGAATSITRSRDYSIRVEHNSTDELGHLCKAFNGMLEEIQRSKQALQKAHDHLEDRVTERTSQLTKEVEQRRKVQAELEQAKEAAEAANEAKSQFLANMSHEIRTPLNGVLGFTTLLLRGADKDEACRHNYLETIEKSGTHLLALLNDVLDLSKIEAGQLDVDCVQCSPYEIITEVISILRARAQEKGLCLECQWSGEVPTTIVTDPARLRQLLTNLVGNAIKFTDQGCVKILPRLDREENRLVIEVSDTGIGIASEDLDSIFDPFVQADNSVTRRFDGTGLGLAISRRIASALGGYLTVHSTLGSGSTFSVAPDTGPFDGVKMLASPPSDALRSPAATASTDGWSFDNARVLLVEDGPTNRKLLRVMMEEVGIDVTTAENGQAGVEIASKHPFNLIVMDMQMPVMDGYIATRKLRELGTTVPIIALTAHAMAGDEEKCRAAGCSGYLTKPVDTDDLLRTLAEALGKLGASGARNAVVEKGPSLEVPDEQSPLFSTLPTTKPIFREIVDEFAVFLAKQLDDMHEATTAGDFVRLARLAHSVKGAGGMAGFDALTDPAKRLQCLAEGGQCEEIEATLAELSDLSERISRGIGAESEGAAVRDEEIIGGFEMSANPYCTSDQAAAIPDGEAHAPREHETSNTRFRILIVDDVFVNVKVVRAHLESVGYADIVSVTDATQAVPTVYRDDPDILLLDIMMPEISGLEILQTLRADEPICTTSRPDFDGCGKPRAEDGGSPTWSDRFPDQASGPGRPDPASPQRPVGEKLPGQSRTKSPRANHRIGEVATGNHSLPRPGGGVPGQ